MGEKVGRTVGRKAKEIGALAVSRLREPGLHFVGGVSGLGLQVLRSGGQTWVLRFSIGGKRRDMGLGGYPDVSLSGAREAARVARDLLRTGFDPIEQGEWRARVVCGVAHGDLIGRNRTDAGDQSDGGGRND